MGLYEVPLSMSLLGFGMGTMLANFHMCGIMLLLRAALYMRGPMCFMGLIFSLSGPFGDSGGGGVSIWVVHVVQVLCLLPTTC